MSQTDWIEKLRHDLATYGFTYDRATTTGELYVCRDIRVILPHRALAGRDRKNRERDVRRAIKRVCGKYPDLAALADRRGRAAGDSPAAVEAMEPQGPAPWERSPASVNGAPTVQPAPVTEAPAPTHPRYAPKTCRLEGCGTVFEPTSGAAKYCPAHQAMVCALCKHRAGLHASACPNAPAAPAPPATPETAARARLAATLRGRGRFVRVSIGVYVGAAATGKSLRHQTVILRGQDDTAVVEALEQRFAGLVVRHSSRRDPALKVANALRDVPAAVLERALRMVRKEGS